MAKRPRPLEGIRVLDIATFLAGPFCSTILGEFGAEVIKVEQPGVGDPLRKFGTRHECGDSLVWLSEARNKKSITLNLRDPEGAALLKRLVAESDIVVENFRTGTLERWGLGYEDLKAVNPRLVMLRVTGYGQTGPKAKEPGFARIAHAFSGLTHLTGEAGGKPLMPGSTTIGDYLAGTYGAIGVLMALRVAEQTGEGQYLDVSVHDACALTTEMAVPIYFGTGRTVRRQTGRHAAYGVDRPRTQYQCKDGRYINAMFNLRLTPAQLRNIGEWLDAYDAAEDLLDDRYLDQQVILESQEHISEVLLRFFPKISSEEAYRGAQERGLAWGAVRTVDDILDDPHWRDRGYFVEVEHPELGESFTYPGTWASYSDTPLGIERRAPLLGEHNAEVYAELGLDGSALAALRAGGAI